jgi:hypothetical protein
MRRNSVTPPHTNASGCRIDAAFLSRSSLKRHRARFNLYCCHWNSNSGCEFRIILYLIGAERFLNPVGVVGCEPLHIAHCRRHIRPGIIRVEHQKDVGANCFACDRHLSASDRGSPPPPSSSQPSGRARCSWPSPRPTSPASSFKVVAAAAMSWNRPLGRRTQVSITRKIRCLLHCGPTELYR